MAMSSQMKKSIFGVISGGALAIAAALIPPLEDTKYDPYLDVVGVPTVCTGHTGPDVVMEKKYSARECRELLNKDLQKVATQVDPLIKRDIPDTTRAALYSFTFNVGVGAFRNSTLLKKINAGDTAGACNELRRWTYAGGKQWKGLTNRREIERELCMWGQQ